MLMAKEEARAIREQVQSYRYPEPELENSYQQFKKFAQKKPEILDPDIDYEGFARRYGKDKAYLMIEQGTSGMGPYGMTANDALEAFRTRYQTERLINAELRSRSQEIKTMGQEKNIPPKNPFLSSEDMLAFGVAPVGGMEVTYDENGKPQFSYNAEKASQSMMLGAGLVAGKKAFSKRATSLPSKASKTTSLPAKLANSADASLLAEAKKYKTADEFVEARLNPKTVRLWEKSRFSDGGAYADIPVLRRVEGVTLYQGGVGQNRQHWTSNKKYAEQFGQVAEKKGTFYQIDNGNRMIDVFVEAPAENKSQLVDIWKRANKT